jgi:hypothetical protein
MPRMPHASLVAQSDLQGWETELSDLRPWLLPYIVQSRATESLIGLHTFKYYLGQVMASKVYRQLTYLGTKYVHTPPVRLALLPLLPRGPYPNVAEAWPGLVGVALTLPFLVDLVEPTLPSRPLVVILMTNSGIPKFTSPTRRNNPQSAERRSALTSFSSNPTAKG